MEARSRIERTKERAEAQLRLLRDARTVAERQAAWEAFIASWRTALNQLEAHCRRHGQDQAPDQWNADRVANPLLHYVWHARNAEEHSATGTSEAALVPMPITLGGLPITLAGEPLTLGKDLTLRFRDLEVRRRGRRFVLSAPTLDPLAVASEAAAFLQRCHDAVWG